MAVTMSSPWDISSTNLLQAKLRLTSKSHGTCPQYPLFTKSSSKKTFPNASKLFSYGWRDPEKEIRLQSNFLTNNSKSAAAADSSSTESVTTEAEAIFDRVSSPPSTDQDGLKGTEEAQSRTPKRAPLTAREKLRAARVLSRYTESKQSKPAMGSSILDALRETDRGKTRSGLPEAPTTLFDDSGRGLQEEGWKFELPGGNDLFIIVFSFVFITTVMFATTYVVWKAGGIHFNEL